MFQITAKKDCQQVSESTISQKALHYIGTLNEKHLHASLKEWYALPNDQQEVSIDGFHIDIVRDNLLIEIQSRNFSAIKRKLIKLTSCHHVRLVCPIVLEKWIVKHAKDGCGRSSRRKSPKKEAVEHIFNELIRFPKLLLNPNFSIEVLFIQEEEVRRYDGKKGWRRKGWVTQERRLLQVMGQQLFETSDDIATLMPDDLTGPFTTFELASSIDKPNWLGQKMAYCLREMNIIVPIGKRRNAILYNRATAKPVANKKNPVER